MAGKLEQILLGFWVVALDGGFHIPPNRTAFQLDEKPEEPFRVVRRRSV